MFVDEERGKTRFGVGITNADWECESEGKILQESYRKSDDIECKFRTHDAFFPESKPEELMKVHVQMSN